MLKIFGLGFVFVVSSYVVGYCVGYMTSSYLYNLKSNVQKIYNRINNMFTFK